MRWQVDVAPDLGIDPTGILPEDRVPAGLWRVGEPFASRCGPLGTVCGLDGSSREFIHLMVERGNPDSGHYLRFHLGP